MATVLALHHLLPLPRTNHKDFEDTLTPPVKQCQDAIRDWHEADRAVQVSTMSWMRT